jgi:TolA-binding protein
MLSLALVEMQQQHMSEAAGWAGKVLALLPSLPEAHFYNAAANLAMGNDAAAENSARMVVAGPDARRYPRAYFILGNILARKGEIPEAAAQFRKFLEVEPSSRAAEAVKQQLAEWQSGGKLN